MKIVFSKTFADIYQSLPKSIATMVDKAIRLLTAKQMNQKFHPSLQVKKIQGTVDIWEARVTLDYRLTFQMYQDTLYLRVVGKHDPTLKRP